MEGILGNTRPYDVVSSFIDCTAPKRMEEIGLEEASVEDPDLYENDLQEGEVVL